MPTTYRVPTRPPGSKKAGRLEVTGLDRRFEALNSKVIRPAPRHAVQRMSPHSLARRPVARSVGFERRHRVESVSNPPSRTTGHEPARGRRSRSLTRTFVATAGPATTGQDPASGLISRRVPRRVTPGWLCRGSPKAAGFAGSTAWRRLPSLSAAAEHTADAVPVIGCIRHQSQARGMPPDVDWS
jgi:hypothetical protein